MSVQSDVMDFLAAVAKGAESSDFLPMDPGKVAEQVGTTRNKVNKTLFNLTQTGKIELQRAQNGRNITGFKLLVDPATIRRRTTTNGRTVKRERFSKPVTIGPDQPRRVMRRAWHTPALDEYAASKEKYRRLTEELGDLVEAQFKENAYAEEGLMLRERLMAIEENYGPLHNENESLKRELRVLKGRVHRELAESVAKTERAYGDS